MVSGSLLVLQLADNHDTAERYWKQTQSNHNTFFYLILKYIKAWWDVLDTALCDKLKMSVTCDRSVVSVGTPVSSTNKTIRHNIAKILLKVALNTVTLTLQKVRYLKRKAMFDFDVYYFFHSRVMAPFVHSFPFLFSYY